VGARTWFVIVSSCVAIILTQGRVSAGEHEFRYKAPDAKGVELMCEFNGWKAVSMTKGDDGVWTAKVSLSPGTYAYKFLVNGTDWVFDPENSAKKTVDGIENSAVEIK
jgi:1,4-alpha-glucan branching enzyme